MNKINGVQNQEMEEEQQLRKKKSEKNKDCCFKKEKVSCLLCDAFLIKFDVFIHKIVMLLVLK